MKTKAICFFFLLLGAAFATFTFAQGNPEKALRKAGAFASACIVEPLGITKESDLVWEWRGDASSKAFSSQPSELQEASFTLIARPAAVFCLSLPASTMAFSGAEALEITGFLANAMMEGDGSYSIHLQAVPQIMKDQKQGYYSGRFEVCLAYN